MPVEVKICGITTVEDARQAALAGADYIGCVLYSGSVRAVTPDVLCRIAEAVGDCVPIVGVFVNPSPTTVMTLIERAGLAAVQVHGAGNPETFAGLPVPLWRAVAFSDRRVVPDPAQWAMAERFLVDAAMPGLHGGTGQVADWDKASQFAQSFCMMLAGGLTPVNVADAIRKVDPFGVDTASGVEQAPGKKDHRAVEAFIRHAKQARPA